jgi:hypothetical protein
MRPTRRLRIACGKGDLPVKTRFLLANIVLLAKIRPRMIMIVVVVRIEKDAILITLEGLLLCFPNNKIPKTRHPQWQNEAMKSFSRRETTIIAT